MNAYTNRSNGSIVTNSGSAWLQQTNGTTIYSLAGSSPVGTWNGIAGSGTALSSYGFYQDGNGQVISGIISSTNLTDQILRGATNVLSGVTTNLQFTFNTTRTNTLYFTNGLLVRVTAP